MEAVNMEEPMSAQDFQPEYLQLGFTHVQSIRGHPEVDSVQLPWPHQVSAQGFQTEYLQLGFTHVPSTSGNPEVDSDQLPWPHQVSAQCFQPEYLQLTLTPGYHTHVPSTSGHPEVDSVQLPLPHQGRQPKPILGRWSQGIGDSRTPDIPQRSTFCPFCRQNGELATQYLSHNLRDTNGKVTCPILSAYVCPHCGATGHRAHTQAYCPKKPIGQPSCLILMKSQRNSTGIRKMYRALK